MLGSIKNRNFGNNTTKNYTTTTKKGHNTTKSQGGEGHSILNRYTRKNDAHCERKRVYSNKNQR